MENVFRCSLILTPTSLINTVTTRHINVRYKFLPKPTLKIIGTVEDLSKCFGLSQMHVFTVWVVANLNTEAILGQSSLVALKSLTIHLWWQSITISSSAHCLRGKFMAVHRDHPQSGHRCQAGKFLHQG